MAEALRLPSMGCWSAAGARPTVAPVERRLFESLPLNEVTGFGPIEKA